jgi:CrcB protein
MQLPDYWEDSTATNDSRRDSGFLADRSHIFPLGDKRGSCMYHVFLVGLGGCLGAISRYMLGSWVIHHAADWRFPLATFVVNVTGCLVAGILTGLIQKFELLTPDARLFLFTGILGGFTTFSAFGLETMMLLQRHELNTACSYVVLSVLCGLLAFWTGMQAVALAAR